jgi:hypothetical protein
MPTQVRAPSVAFMVVSKQKPSGAKIPPNRPRSVTDRFVLNGRYFRRGVERARVGGRPGRLDRRLRHVSCLPPPPAAIASIIGHRNFGPVISARPLPISAWSSFANLSPVVSARTTLQLRPARSPPGTEGSARAPARGVWGARAQRRTPQLPQ